MEAELRSFLAENFLLGEEFRGMPGSASLIDAGIIDSTGVLELVGFLEEAFEIEITDSELVPENLDSIDNVVRFVGAKRNSGHTK
jgi:acyl carrier protein